MNRFRRDRLAGAIRDAEAGTTGHIVVRVVPDESVDAFERAKSEFEAAGLHRAKYRNAAMILVAPKARAYAVLGDKALHEKLGDAFWIALVAEMRPRFAAGDTDGAIVHAVKSIGTQLHEHFPAHA